jgi:hypothetical protein
MTTRREDNINKLLPLLKARLRSSNHVASKDNNGNVVYTPCEIFSNDILSSFLSLALMDFNQVPSFTFFQFDDDRFVEQFGGILIEGATLYALSSQALIERGREFLIHDNGISFEPPTVSEMLNTQFSTLLEHHWRKLQLIKEHIKEFQSNS